MSDRVLPTSRLLVPVRVLAFCLSLGRNLLAERISIAGVSHE